MNLLKVSIERDNGISTLSPNEGVWLSVSIGDAVTEQEIRDVLETFIALLMERGKR